MRSMGDHGQGGITKRTDGRLQVSLTMPSGRRVYRTVPAMIDPKRQRRLAEELRRQLVAAREADLDPAGQTLADYLRSWLTGMASATNARVRPGTLSFYRTVTERHIIPTLGGYKLERLSERHVQAWLDGLRMHPRYVHHCRAVLRRALNIAMRQRILARNPAIAVELPSIPEFRPAPMTAAEAHALLAASAGDRLAALWRLGLVTGLRSGELLALSWADLDLAVGTVSVTARLARQDGQWVRVPTKADRSLERVAIDPATVAVLEAHKVRQAVERQPEWPYWGLVFTTRNGYPIDRHEVIAEFRLACDAAGIARRRFHDVRHSSATIMRDLGIDREVRKARLGHSTDRMAEHYAQASTAQDRAAVERLADAIG
jgi:integrase